MPACDSLPRFRTVARCAGAQPSGGRLCAYVFKQGWANTDACQWLFILNFFGGAHHPATTFLRVAAAFYLHAAYRRQNDWQGRWWLAGLTTEQAACCFALCSRQWARGRWHHGMKTHERRDWFARQQRGW